MSNETNEKLKVRSEELTASDFLYSLISLDEFKSLMGVDDRDEKTARFCLVTSTLTIEEYCKRKFLYKRYFEDFKFDNCLTIFLREYPVEEILAVYLLGSGGSGVGSGELLESEFYRIYPDCGNDLDICCSIEFSPALLNYSIKSIKIIYTAGYQKRSEVEPTVRLEVRSDEIEKSKRESYAQLPVRNTPLFVPADLAAACLELAAWNFNRYKSKRIGMSGNIRGAGVQGEHFEMSLPENVRQLIEPYKRKVI